MITFKNDVEAYRYSGGSVDSFGRYLTTRQTIRLINSPNEAISMLNLSEGNLATNLNKFIIPGGTTAYVGRVAGGGARATQIFIDDAKILRLR